MMPELDGMEVLKQVRKTDKDLPIYILTAYSTEDRKARSAAC
jgi:DNA-binding response OmpR family regulator